MATKLKMDPSQLLKILQGKLHLSEGNIEGMIEFCKLKKTEAEYFRLLVGYNKARSPEQARLYFEKLALLSGAPGYELNTKEYLFFLQWYYSGIWCALNIYDCDGTNLGDLGQFMTPAISEKETKACLDMLEKMGLIKKNTNGFFKATNPNLTTGTQWKSLAVRQYQKQMIKLGGEALERFSKDERDISTLTLNTSPEVLEEMRAVTAEYRQKMIKLSNQCPSDTRVFQLNVQLFPITQPIVQGK
jgi:uncharacterized protein (TIGR02147 family)